MHQVSRFCFRMQWFRRSQKRSKGIAKKGDAGGRRSNFLLRNVRITLIDQRLNQGLTLYTETLHKLPIFTRSPSLLPSESGFESAFRPIPVGTPHQNRRTPAVFFARCAKRSSNRRFDGGPSRAREGAMRSIDRAAMTVGHQFPWGRHSEKRR